MADSDEITCRIAFWFFRRMAMIIGLLIAGGLWFMYDGKVGWPKKNVVALAKGAFEAGKNDTSWEDFATDPAGDYADAELDDEEAIGLIKEAHAEGGNRMPWNEFILSTVGKESSSKAGEPAVKAAFTAGSESESTWSDYATDSGLPPDSAAAASAEGGVDRFVALQTAFEAARKKREWGLYGKATGRKKWGEDVKYHKKSEIGGQYAFAYGLWVIAAGMLVWTVINSRRYLKADSDSFTTETGAIVPFSEVFRIDKRKWDNKGLGYAFYRTESGAEKRAVLDDLKYVGTVKILDRLMENFEGELVERMSADEEDEGDGVIDAEAEVSEVKAKALEAKPDALEVKSDALEGASEAPESSSPKDSAE